MRFLNKKFGLLIITLLISVIGYSQDNINQKKKIHVLKTQISSSLALIFNLEYKQDVKILIEDVKDKFIKEFSFNDVKSKDCKIDLSLLVDGTYNIIVIGENNNVIYKEIIQKH